MEFQYKAGLWNAGSYVVSGIPWVTSSITAPLVSSTPKEISFPSVTRTITVKNISTGTEKLRVGFSSNGVKYTNNYFLLSASESFSAELKVTDIYLLTDSGASAATASIIAGLTGIDVSNLQNNWSGSVGIG
jgi:hypothetical protein